MALSGVPAGTLTYDTELDKTGLNKGLKSVENDARKSGNILKNVFLGLQLDKVVSATMSMITNNINDAVERFDVLNNFPKIMSNLGISAKESQKSIDKMSEKLMGLPTTLDEGAMAVQRFTSKNGDVAKSTDLFLALNNALLAGGAGADIQSSALEQLAQAYAKGKPDMMEWRTAMMAMPAQLKQVATAMGYVDADALGEALRDGSVSMDDFMNTIVKLNEKGLDGFQNFEQQAKNSTDGIQTALKNMHSRITQGLTAMIDETNKGLKKVGIGSLAKVFEKVGNTIRDALKNLAKYIVPVINGTIKLLKILKTLKPVILSVVAAYIAYKTTLKAISLINMIKNITGTVTAFISLIPAIKSAKDAMLLLNTTFNANPIGLIAGAIATVVSALVIFNQNTKKTNKELENQTSKINDNKQAWKDLQKEKQNEINVGMTEISHYQALYDELKNIVDANGRIKDGYKERASFIVTTLNEALGTEIKMTGDVISGYKGIEDEIKKVIKQKKAQIILDSQKDIYSEALQKQQEGLKTLNDLEETLNKRKKEREKLSDEYWEMMEKPHFKWQINAIKERIDNYDNETEKIQKNYNNQKDLLQKYTYSVGQYESNMALAHEGKYDEMTTVTWDYVKDVEKAGDAEKKSIEEQIKEQETLLNILKEQRKKTGSDIYNDQITTAEKQLQNLKDNLKKYSETTDTELKNVKLTWRKDLDEQLSEITGKNIKFKETANGTIQAYIDGVKQGKPKSKKEMSKLVEETIKEISNKKTGSEKAGLDLINGLNNGIGNKTAQNGVFKTIANFGSNLLSKFKSALKEHSPSKATEEDAYNFLKGFKIGINKNKKSVYNTIDNLGDNIVDKFNNNINTEQLLKNIDKINQQVIDKMSGEINLQSNKLNANAALQASYSFGNNIIVQGNLESNVSLDGRKVGQETAPYVMKAIKNGGI